MEIYYSSMLLLVIKGRFKHAALVFGTIIIIDSVRFKRKEGPSVQSFGTPTYLTFSLVQFFFFFGGS